MRNKDTHRLNAVRSVLNEVSNASKTSSPITTDLQLLSVLRKRTSSAQTASKEAKDAGRPELSEKEDAQIAIFDEYAGSVKTMGIDEIKQTISDAIEDMKRGGSKVTIGDVSKRVLGPGGEFDGKPVEKTQVARAIKDALQ